MLDVYDSRALFKLVDGPAGTGKTRGLMELCHFMCKSWPRARILWAMNERETMTETVLATFEELVLPDGCPLLDGPSRAHRRSYDYPNGSKILLRGLLDPQKTRSMELDWAVVFEATNTTEEGVLMLLRTLRWGALPFRQLICETNPGPPQHWLMQRVLDGKMTRFISKHTDNPRYWDARKKQWTPDGQFYVENVLDQYTGVLRDRLKDGKWVADENSVFDLNVLLAHRHEFGEEPWHVGTLVCSEEGKVRDKKLRKRDASIVSWQEADKGLEPGRVGAEWKLWCDLFPDPRTRIPRPDPGMLPVLFADVSWGQGASNSIISVGDRTTGRKIAEFASANIAPEEFGRILVMAGLWFGGQKGQGFLGWEYNGPGKSVTKIAAHTLSYPWCYEHQTRKRGRAEKAPKAIVGWVNNRESKIDLALELRDGYAQGEFFNPSKAAIDETMAWVRYKNGGIGPAKLMEESPEAQQTHGDRTIGDMGLWHMMQVCPMYAVKPMVERGSIADRNRDEEADLLDVEDDG